MAPTGHLPYIAQHSPTHQTIVIWHKKQPKPILRFPWPPPTHPIWRTRPLNSIGLVVFTQLGVGERLVLVLVLVLILVFALYVLFAAVAFCPLLIACCLLQITCCLLPITYYLLLAACCLLPIAYCQLPVASCLLPVACCLLFVACCLLFAACCLLPITYYLLPVAYCLLPAVYCLSPILFFIACCLLPLTHSQLPNAYCLLVVAYCLLPIAYCPLLIPHLFLLIFYCLLLFLLVPLCASRVYHQGQYGRCLYLACIYPWGANLALGSIQTLLGKLFHLTRVDVQLGIAWQGAFFCAYQPFWGTRDLNGVVLLVTNQLGIALGFSFGFATFVVCYYCLLLFVYCVLFVTCCNCCWYLCLKINRVYHQ